MARDLATRGGEDCDSVLMARVGGAVERGCLVSGEVDRQGGGADGEAEVADFIGHHAVHIHQSP